MNYLAIERLARREEGSTLRMVMRMPLADWTIVARYPTVFDAERAKATLESQGIAAMIQSHAGAAFGPGFQGPVSGGVSLLVPASELERAWELVVETE